MNIVSLKSFLKISIFGSQQDSDPLETICVKTVEDIYDAGDLKAYEASFSDQIQVDSKTCQQIEFRSTTELDRYDSSIA